jgi:hypothetical protein
MGISNRDWAQLSALLDHELGKRESERLQKRIASDPQLKAAFKQLKATKELLQESPRMPVPRNFVLTPEMVGIKMKQPSYKRFRLAAAVLSFLLVGVLVLDFSRFLAIGAMAPAPQYQEIALESAPEAPAEAVEEPAMKAGEGEFEGDQFQVEAEDEPVEEEVAAPGAETGESAAEGVWEEDQDQRTLMEEPEVEQNFIAEEEVLDSAEGIEATITPQPQPTATLFIGDEISRQQPRGGRFPVFRALEVALGVGALGFGLTAWWKRRQIMD